MANDSAVLIPIRRHEMPANGVVSCSSLKRKRPPKIDIPNVLREISVDIFKERSAQGPGDGALCFAHSGVAVFSIKGNKKFMEDAYNIFHSSNGNKDFFGVYDGHGGSMAAEFVAENLNLNIFEMLENLSEKEKETAVKEGYLKTDEEYLKQGLGSGVCCVTALIDESEIVVSNLGDCRAVLCRNGIAEAVTTDHKPAREDERKRIQDKGGYVEMHRGTWRVHGTLAVSRSIGDAHLKDWVIAEPDTRVIDLTADMEYIVLASDGLWGEVGNQEVIGIVKQSCSSSKKHVGSSPAKKGSVFPCRSPSTSFSPSLKPKRAFHSPNHKSIHHKECEGEQCCENGNPASKSQRISLATQMKVRTLFPDNENAILGEKPTNGGLLTACKELVNLAVARGCLDDITVMIVDLNRYKG